MEIWGDYSGIAILDRVRRKRYVGKLPNVSCIIADSRGHASLKWRMEVHYGQATTHAEGRVAQGGAHKPYVVSTTALKAYYNIL